MSDWDGMSDRRGGTGGLHPEAREKFATILERIENLRDDFREHKDEDNKRFDKIDGRITPLEKGFWKATGMATGAAVLVTFVAKYFKLGGQ
jgi:hypothetical protein